jgi:hypothetical protein
MNQVEKAPVRRALHLTSPIDSFPGVRVFVVGELDVTAIEQAESGAYDVHVGPKLVRVPAHRIDHYEQDPRPGYGRERPDFPSYAVPQKDGTFDCGECGRNFHHVHGLKVHFGINHGDQR